MDGFWNFIFKKEKKQEQPTTEQLFDIIECYPIKNQEEELEEDKVIIIDIF